MHQTPHAFYPIGRPGQPWDAAERGQWLAQQRVQRSYAEEVITQIDALRDQFQVQSYGQLDYGDGVYRLYALRSQPWLPQLPTALVTGGVHGYETSGVQGALQFARECAADYAGKCNLLILPCLSPWGYERIQRWNALAIDPNRSFVANSPAPEAAAVMALIATLQAPVLVHVDLHETTDSDETEFRPALAARDGKAFEPGGIPDGFYLVDDTVNPQPAFQQAVIAAVEKVTHIAPADAQGEIIGSPVVAHGVIQYPLAALGLCASVSGARYTTTTEVYPDSPRASAARCNQAQVASICGALDYALAHA